MRSLRSSRPLRSARAMAVATTVAVAALGDGRRACLCRRLGDAVHGHARPGRTRGHAHDLRGRLHGGGTVSLELFAGDFSGTMVEPSDPTVDTVDATANVSGVWSDTMTAPATAKTGDKLTVWARCFGESSTFTYVNVAVTVVDPADTTTTTAAAATTTTTAAATSTTVAAAPAAAVPATPTFTG